jgi:hypothetical protein
VKGPVIPDNEVTFFKARLRFGWSQGDFALEFSDAEDRRASRCFAERAGARYHTDLLDLPETEILALLLKNNSAGTGVELTWAIDLPACSQRSKGKGFPDAAQLASDQYATCVVVPFWKNTRSSVPAAIRLQPIGTTPTLAVPTTRRLPAHYPVAAAFASMFT